jgi:pectinesterase
MKTRLAWAALLWCAAASVDAAPPATRAKVRVVLAGDSTVTDDAGWGGAFARRLAGDVECVNLAQGGRSSGSFVAEGWWRKCLDLRPDYVLIQFGHNDQPGHGDRTTDPETSYRKNMTRYVQEARAGGIQPVLVTPLTRREFGADGRLHSSLAPYSEVVKRIAAEEDIPLIDLHARSIALCESLGLEGCQAISPRKEDGSFDGTHLNAKGAELVAPLVADELLKVVPALARSIKSDRSVSAGDGKTLTVAADGSGDFATVQEAIAAVPDNSPVRTVIRIKPGRYPGPILVPETKSKVTFEGRDAGKTILTYALNVYESQEPQPAGYRDTVAEGRLRGYRGTGVVILGDDFHAREITFENTSGDHGQALALRIDGDRAVLEGCQILGWQDTLMVNDGRQYFRDCTIEGRVDFIYGSGTAVFDRCEIRSKNGGYVTAASTPPDRPFGFVFLNCRLTGDPTSWSNPFPDPAVPAPPPRAFLGRPWRPHASVTFINCEMGDHIQPEGWDNWGKPENEKTARYAESNSTGPGAHPERRVAWSRQLTEEQAKKITVDAVLSGQDGWKPGG